MTINTWRNSLYGVCKYCEHFYCGDHIEGWLYQCGKYGCSIYDARKYGKTGSLRKQAVDGEAE